MSWIEPKLNWDKNDYYNYWDLDRVENNTKVVADILGIPVETKTDRDYTSIPYAEELNRIESNIEKLSYLPIKGLKEMKTNWTYKDSFDWQDAVRLEENLKILYDILIKNETNKLMCGTFNCGEEVI